MQQWREVCVCVPREMLEVGSWKSVRSFIANSARPEDLLDRFDLNRDRSGVLLRRRVLIECVGALCCNTTPQSNGNVRKTCCKQVHLPHRVGWIKFMKILTSIYLYSWFSWNLFASRETFRIVCACVCICIFWCRQICWKHLRAYEWQAFINKSLRTLSKRSLVRWRDCEWQFVMPREAHNKFTTAALIMNTIKSQTCNIHYVL